VHDTSLCESVTDIAWVSENRIRSFLSSCDHSLTNSYIRVALQLPQYRVNRRTNEYQIKSNLLNNKGPRSLLQIAKIQKKICRTIKTITLHTVTMYETNIKGMWNFIKINSTKSTLFTRLRIGRWVGFELVGFSQLWVPYNVTKRVRCIIQISL